jgi:hypothetical protein
MTQSRQPEDRDLITRVARLEYRLTQIESSNTLLQETIAPGGYVTDGFERVVDRIEGVEDRIDGVENRLINRIDGVEDRLRFEIKNKNDELKTEINQRFDAQDLKFDMILCRLSGESNLE